MVLMVVAVIVVVIVIVMVVIVIVVIVVVVIVVVMVVKLPSHLDLHPTPSRRRSPLKLLQVIKQTNNERVQPWRERER